MQNVFACLLIWAVVQNNQLNTGPPYVILPHSSGYV